MIWNTIIVSDIHLGTSGSKSEWFLEFLETHRCRTLILNGDIVDGWALNRGSRWRKRHTRVVNAIMKMSWNTDIIWIRGNHDEFLNEFCGMKLGNIEIKEDHIIRIKRWNGEDSFSEARYYVFHGDSIDIFMLKYSWLSKIGSIGYDFALWLNTYYNKWRNFRGKTYLSISKPLKAYVKSAANYINDFETTAAKMAEKHGCVGVICGHIHQDADRWIDGIHYLNSGDWVENMSAIMIDDAGNITLYKKPFKNEN
jgi:UDP-2,3-diacylglucosamine pyrophosphatase LpxH